MSKTSRNSLILLVAIVAIFIVAVVLGTKAAEGEDEAFGGTDGAATSAIEDTGYEPWYEPLMSPAGEVESGLFALQAALGAGAVGFALGTLRERNRNRAENAKVAERADGPPSA